MPKHLELNNYLPRPVEKLVKNPHPVTQPKFYISNSNSSPGRSISDDDDFIIIIIITDADALLDSPLNYAGRRGHRIQNKISLRSAAD